jgi:hypothetical protein
MSGYLGRMLQAAVGSELRLHPMAGSIYGERDTSAEQSLRPDLGEPLRTEDQDPAQSERTVVSRGLAAPVATTQAAAPVAFFEQYEPLQPPRRRPEAHRPGVAELSSQPRADLDAPHGRDPVRAMKSYHEPSDTTPRMRDRSDADGDATQVRGGLNLQDMPSKAAADRATGERSVTVARDWNATPAQGELAPRNAAPTVASDVQAWPAARHQTIPRHEAARHRRTEESEVQVHIGRIEVLAVQPPAPAAPAPRRERTTSLVDYLAGRNGRGR